MDPVTIGLAHTALSVVIGLATGVPRVWFARRQARIAERQHLLAAHSHVDVLERIRANKAARIGFVHYPHFVLLPNAATPMAVWSLPTVLHGSIHFEQEARQGPRLGPARPRDHQREMVGVARQRAQSRSAATNGYRRARKIADSGTLCAVVERAQGMLLHSFP
jgi:uncharacterized protein YigA (DUF484 family)